MDLLTYLNINRLDYKIKYYSYLKLFVTDVNLVFYRYNINSKIYILNNIYYLLFIIYYLLFIFYIYLNNV